MNTPIGLLPSAMTFACTISLKRILRSYFHLPDELKAEIDSAGFADTDVRGVIGPAWLIPDLDEMWKDEKKRESIMRIVRLCEKEESIMGLSTHLLTISSMKNR